MGHCPGREVPSSAVVLPRPWQGCTQAGQTEADIHTLPHANAAQSSFLVQQKKKTETAQKAFKPEYWRSIGIDYAET